MTLAQQAERLRLLNNRLAVLAFLLWVSMDRRWRV